MRKVEELANMRK